MIAAHELAERALAAARPGDQVVVIVDDTTHTHLRWADGVTTSAGHVLDRQVHVAVVTPEHTAGVVSAGGALDAVAVRDLVAAASSAARRSDAEADIDPLVPADRSEALDWREPAASASPAVLGGLAAEIAEAARRFSARGRALHGYAEHEVRTTLLGTSTGTRRRHVQPAAVIDLTARGGAESVSTRTGPAVPDLGRRHGRPAASGGAASAWAGVEAPDLADLRLPVLLDDLEQRMDWGRRRVDVRPGRYEVLLPPSCTADLMQQLYWAAGGPDAADGRTVFAAPDGGTRLGDRLSALPLTLRSDPAEKGLECDPFVVTRTSGPDTSVADNGVALGPTNWITDGVLTALVHTRASARRADHRVTPRVGNLVLEGPPGGPTLPEMIASTRHGLLLTSLWYLREVDARTLRLTGLTRDGVYVVRDGEVVGAADDFRFNESPVQLLDRITEVGATAVTLPREVDDERARTAMPPVRVTDFAAVAAGAPA